MSFPISVFHPFDTLPARQDLQSRLTSYRFLSLVASEEFASTSSTPPRPFRKPIMTHESFEMDNPVPDWTEEFDFGAFLDFPPDDDDQGGEER